MTDGTRGPMSRRGVILVLTAAVAIAVVIAGVVSGAGPFGCDRPTDEGSLTSPEPMTDFIVAFNDDSEKTRQSVLDEAGDELDVTLEVVLEMALDATVVVHASEPLDEGRQGELIEALQDTCEVRYAHPNFEEHTT